MTDYTYSDRVRETTTTTGTGNLTLAGAATGYVSFSAAFGVGSFVYAVSSAGGAEWEVGVGSLSGGALVRSTVLASSNSNALVSFSAGTKDVFSTIPAAELNKLTTLAQVRRVSALRL